MSRPMDEHEARKYLSAFADGELEVEQNLRVLDHMAMNLQATRRVMHQEQLRRAVSQAMRSSAPPAPSSLREVIERAARSGTVDDAVNRRPALARLVSWLPAAVAAVLLIGTLVALNIGEAYPGSDASTATVRYSGGFGKRHDVCAGDPGELAGRDAFAVALTELPARIADHLGRPSKLDLDLSRLGYDFVAAGECNVPGEPSVHMIYRARTQTGGPRAISLWIKMYEGHPAIEADRIYAVEGTDADQPVLLWRRADILYFLVGDRTMHINEAAAALSGL